MKQRIHNLIHTKKQRRQLRKEATGTEKILWYKIRNSQLGHKFRRQHGIGDYIADFYCPEKKLVIELDGEIHGDKLRMNHDLIRDDFLQQGGLKAIRYTNEQILKNLDAVLQDIINRCQQSTSPSPPFQGGENKIPPLGKGG
ncbi:MAG: endonuclease domain-containing protein [Patescibacteria group bacterium]